MTINSEWIKIWKETSKHSFSKNCPFRPSVAFIDGQIKLMKPAHVNTWDRFVHCQFASCIQRHFQAGCHTVVLAFDNYEHVPSCKGMTQSKRNKKVSAFKFASGDCLPAIIPDCWEDAIRNRLFKSRVIDLVKTRLPSLLALEGHQRLVIDHNEAPIEYLPTGMVRPFPLPHDRLKGESDVKFTSYTHLGPMVIDAIDGDYVPMALVHVENRARQDAEVPQIAIHRIRVRTKSDPGEAKMSYEHVHINRLAADLCQDLALSMHGRRTACRVLALFAILTGCDYTQGLPTVGPIRLWTHRHTVVPLLSQITGDEDSHDDDVAIIALASALLYSMVYEKRISVRVNQSATQPGVACTARSEEGARLIRAIRSTGSITEGTAAKLPDSAYLMSHSSNALWTLLYWDAEELHPDPYSKTYGYKRARTGAPDWGVNRAKRKA
eukprot:16344-Hanusia_phi.AAC.9